MLSPLQERVAEIIAGLKEAEGFALAGGAALVDALPVKRQVVLDTQIDRIDEGERIVVATGSSAPQSALTGTAQIFSVNAFVSSPV